MNYTYTLTGSAEEKAQGRITFTVIDIIYNLSWKTELTAFRFLEQNPSLKTDKFTIEEVLNVLSDLMYKAFTSHKGVRLLIETSGTQQLTLKCDQSLPPLVFSTTLTFDTYNNLTSILDDIKSAFQNKLGPILEQLESLNTRVGSVEAMFARIVTNSTTIQSVPTNPEHVSEPTHATPPESAISNHTSGLIPNPEGA